MGLGFLQSFVNGIQTLMQDIFGGVGQSIAEVFQSWGHTVTSTYGVWAPAGLVLGIGAAVGLGYLCWTGLRWNGT